MVEAAAVLAIVLLVMALGWLSPLPLLVIGAVVAALGLLVSAVVGLAYHRRLLRAATRQGAAPPGWWWAPSRLHHLLDEAGRSTVLPVWRAGVAAVVVAFAGLALVAVAAAKAWLMSR